MESAPLIKKGQYRQPEYDNGHKDKLVDNLPEELRPYLRQSTQSNVECIQRNPGWAFTHQVLAVLGNVYSLCNMHLVKKGQIGLTWNNGDPEILPPGRHCLLSPVNSLDKIVSDQEKVIRHGPINIIRVGVGELGFGIEGDTGAPLLLMTGKHVIRSTTFIFERFITLTEQTTKIGNLDLVRVETGHIGYAYRSGQLQILEPGLHVISPPDRFGGLMSTQLSIIELPESIHESSDYVPLKIKSAVFYRIDDPLKALTRVRDVTQQIQDTAISTLAGIIRSSSLADVARGSSQVKYEVEEPSNEDGNPSAPPFYQYVHDEFLSKLAAHVLEDWGIEIQNIRIESLKIADQSLHESISQQAVTISEQRSRYLMLTKQTEIIGVEAENESTKKRLAAQAEADALLYLAKAEAQAKTIRAESEKQATILRGEGEAEYAALLNQTPLGRQLAALQLQKECLAGIEQIMYVPHIPSMFKEGQGIFMDANMVMPRGSKEENL